MTDFLSEYSRYCNQHGTPERVELLLCDLNSVLRGKWLPGDQVEKLLSGDVRLPISTYAPTIMGSEPPETGLGIVVGDPDGFIRPVSGTLQPVPWANESVAQVLVEMTNAKDSTEISALSSRQLLADVLGRFEKHGWRPVVASELEFYIVKRRASADQAPEPPEHLPEAQNYEMGVLDEFSQILTEIQIASEVQGLATDTLIAEFGPGQFEINFHHSDDVLGAADTALMFRRLVRGVVARHGYEASFMAKPYAHQPGNGMHFHASVLNEDGRNIFDGSDRLQAAVAGVLSTMRDLQLLFAPHMNSYRRFLPNGFSPSRPDWGYDNRRAAVRLPETAGKGARLEHRISGADVNPYLALVAILGGILHGLETDLPLPPALEPTQESTVAPLGHDWLTAINRFAQSEFAAGLMGTYFRDIFAAVKRDEAASIMAEIFPVEYRHYLNRF